MMVPMDNAWRKRLQRRRKELGLTQIELAERMKITQGTIAHWETGRRSPKDMLEWEHLARALEWHLAYLLYGDITVRDGLVHLYSGEDGQPSIKEILLSLPPERREAEFRAILSLASLDNKDE